MRSATIQCKQEGEAKVTSKSDWHHLNPWGEEGKKCKKEKKKQSQGQSKEVPT